MIYGAIIMYRDFLLFAKIIFCLDIFFFILFFTNPTFGRMFKIFISFFSHKKRFIKISIYYSIAINTFMNHISNKFAINIFIKVRFIRLTVVFINCVIVMITSFIVTVTPNNMILIFFSVLTTLFIISCRF